VPYLIIVLATLTRFIPPAWSFSPVYGALLFGGANLKKLDSIWFSAITPGISDVVLTKFSYHLHLGRDELFQTAAFASIAWIGWILKSRSPIGRLTFPFWLFRLRFISSVISGSGLDLIPIRTLERG